MYLIPSLFDITRPVLEYLADGKSIHKTKLAEHLAAHFNLTQAETNETTATGIRRFPNRVTWACVELKGAGLIQKEKAIVSITETGKKILENTSEKIDRKFLREHSPEYGAWLDNETPSNGVGEELEPKTPMDIIDEQYKIIKNDVKNDLLEKILDNPPEFFEEMILKLVRKIGYGITYEVLGQTGDGGIDGVIPEDEFQFGRIYFQAKRWKNSVPIHHVRDFAGALIAKKSDRGIFITTSHFTNDAYAYVKDINQKIVLINGDELTDLMYKHGIGVSVSGTYEIKHTDDDFFSQ